MAIVKSYMNLRWLSRKAKYYISTDSELVSRCEGDHRCVTSSLKNSSICVLKSISFVQFMRSFLLDGNIGMLIVFYFVEETTSPS